MKIETQTKAVAMAHAIRIVRNRVRFMSSCSITGVM
jgi:hypothetical protein